MLKKYLPKNVICIGGEMVCILVSSALVCGFEPWSGQIKHYKVGICGFSLKHTALKSNKKKTVFLFFVV